MISPATPGPIRLLADVALSLSAVACDKCSAGTTRGSAATSAMLKKT